MPKIKSIFIRLRIQAEILLRKSRRIAGRVKRHWPSVNFVQGKFLLTKGENVSYLNLPSVKGAAFYSLHDWQELLDVNASATAY